MTGGTVCQAFGTGQLIGILRSAKDLGRVLALAWLSGREATEQWRPEWEHAIRTCFPKQWLQLAATLGSGLEELSNDSSALDEAQQTTEYGILNGLGVGIEQLTVTAERLVNDVILPLRDSVKLHHPDAGSTNGRNTQP